ncbi:MAG: dTDP-4-dehydrorhamnose 3,5-epimerase, partial [Mycobacterium sp.]|nr:dTDP-4-dehydrorhamnose 3,5-epimerase [Mycobacterium sp.]
TPPHSPAPRQLGSSRRLALCPDRALGASTRYRILDSLSWQHGAVHDVLVDIRRDSPTFGKQQAFLLDDNDFRHLYIPPGFLHGFQALTAIADVCYRIDRLHDPAEDIGVAYDDPELSIAWPLPVTVVSARDASASSWKETLTHLR